jgi:hypothetical protein
MAKAYIVHRKDLSFGIYYTLNTLFREINNREIKANNYYFFANEEKALAFQDQLINKQRSKK